MRSSISPSGELEFAGKRVQGYRGRDRDQARIGIGGARNGRRRELLGEEMAMPLVLTERSTLQSKVAEQRFCRAADQNLDRLVLAGATVALPYVPSPGHDLLDGRVLELDGDEELGRAMEHWIRADEEAKIWIDPHEEGGVEPVRVLPESMQPPVLRPVLDLKAMLVSWPILGGLRIGQECVHHDARPFTRGRLVGNPKRGRLGRGPVNDLAAGCLEPFENEGQQWGSISGEDAICAEVHAQCRFR